MGSQAATMLRVNEAERWRKIGKKFERARKAARLSKRAAASRAGLSEIWWRQLETGERQLTPDVIVPINPRSDNLESAARVVGLDPREIFDLAGRHYIPSEEESNVPVTSGTNAELAAEVSQLRSVVESLRDLIEDNLSREPRADQ